MLFLFLCLFTQAQSRDTVYTTYSSGVFTTKCVVTVNASPDIMNEVIDDYLYQVKFDLDALYKWALKGMKLRKESDDLIIMNFKSTEYDQKEDLVKAIGDVEVPRLITFPDIHVNSKWSKLKTGDKTSVLIDVKYSDAFLKKTTGIFTATPYRGNKKCEVKLITNVEFGWFFNIFITRSMFKKIMEWRFETMLVNIKQEAEKRNAKLSLRNR